MLKKMFSKVLLMLICFMAVLTTSSFAAPIEGKDEGDNLKNACLSATITAIHLEMDRYQRWMDFRKQQGDEKGIAQLQESLDALHEDLIKFQTMDIQDFQLPEKVDEVAWVGDQARTDSILYVANMSKSGPWYHLAGIAGDDYTLLQPNTQYNINLYKVYPRNYWGMNSAYVYITVVDKADKR